MTNLDRTLLLWQNIRPRVERAIANSSTFLDGYPSGGSSGGSGPADHRTAETALVHAYGREDTETGKMTGAHDPHGADRKALEQTIKRLADIVDRLAPSNAAADHAAMKTSDVCPPGCCTSCFRDGGAHERARTPGSKLCRWCADVARSLEMDQPPIALVRTYRMRGRITNADVRAATGGKYG